MQSPDKFNPGRTGAILALVLATILALTPFLDNRALQNYESLFERALITFALARTLNGVISAVQGTEVALQPAGVGVTLTPGQILDPVNDLVERFSWVMLGATISLGVQQVLLEVSAWWVIQILVALLAVWLLVLLLIRKPELNVQRKLLLRVFLVALFIRFAVPMTLIANEMAYELFLEDRYQASSEVISAAGEDIKAMSDEQEAPDPQLPVEEQSFLGDLIDGVGRTFNTATEGMGLKEKVEAIQNRAAEMIQHLIQLSVVFILQTGVLPIAFLWIFLQLGKWLFRPISTNK